MKIKVSLYKNRRKQFYSTLIAPNGNVLYWSEDYKNKADALEIVYAVAAGFGGVWSGLYADHTVKGKPEETKYVPDEWREGMGKLDEKGETESEIN